MPVYEYQCKQCNYRFEQSQSFSEPPLFKCPKCDSESLKKVFSAVGIVFKGSGFYKNDSRGQSGSTTVQSLPKDSSVVTEPKQQSEAPGTSNSNDSSSSTAGSDNKSTSSELAATTSKE